MVPRLFEILFVASLIAPVLAVLLGAMSLCFPKRYGRGTAIRRPVAAHASMRWGTR